MPTQRVRLLELALRGLVAERQRIEDEIRAIQSELGTRRKAAVSSPPSAVPRRRRKARFSAAERRRRAERMRQYWAQRRLAKKAKQES